MLPSSSEFDDIRFNPEQGQIIRHPTGTGYGYWVGGHKVSFDEQTKQFVLFYRERSPLEKARGGNCAIATSSDGIEFTDVWKATKSDFNAASIEVAHCLRGLDDLWKLYISYEVAGAGYWRIDLLEAERLEDLAAQSRRTVFQPTGFGLRSLKDPTVYIQNNQYHAYVIGGSRTAPTRDGDTITTGGGDATLLGISSDGRYFTSLQYVFEPPNSDTWHGRRARINSIIPYRNGWLALYDGGRNFYDTYEERCGLAWSSDGLKFERLDQPQPWVQSKHGCVRYVYAMIHGSYIHYYYEYTREDGAHDLRVSVVRI